MYSGTVNIRKFIWKIKKLFKGWSREQIGDKSHHANPEAASKSGSKRAWGARNRVFRQSRCKVERVIVAGTES